MALVFNVFKALSAKGDLSLLNDNIRIMLVDSSYVANQDNDKVDAGGANDPIDAELSGAGYCRITLAGRTINEDDANDRAEYDADDVTWPGINAGTAAAAIVFKESAVGDTQSILIALIDTGGFPITTNGGDLTIQFNAEGILQLA